MREEFEIKLSRPDLTQSKKLPPHATLFDIAANYGKKARQKPEDVESPLGRMAEATLWTITFTMLHSTLDLLVTHQYATEIDWLQILWRAFKAFPIILLLVYSFHPHPTSSIFLPKFPLRFHHMLHQTGFFLVSIAAGSYLIHATNMHPYYAIMKQVPPIGCLWVWSVVELEIIPAVSSLLCCYMIFKTGGYSLS
ncbi:putative deacetylase-like protein [Golovinomyces cichoracearum]|uniref:Putative deacetylase-like protein n=1 Tax=Golovinomyces cichoracearum TaxID=62708 RepID=A0A420J9H3_9PEZI|nr:putative deacetylase-like protein [Golovinomyces cichoracearum]